MDVETISQIASCFLPRNCEPWASLSLHFHTRKMETVCASRGDLTQCHEMQGVHGGRRPLSPDPPPPWRCEDQPLPGGPRGGRGTARRREASGAEAPCPWRPPPRQPGIERSQACTP